MKKHVLLILVVALLLSGCGMLRAVMTDTAVVERSSEPGKSLSPHAKLETTQVPSETTEITTQTLIEATETETRTPPESTETKAQTTSETTHKTTRIPSTTTAETTGDPTPEVSQTTSQPSEETTRVTLEPSQGVSETTKATDHATTVDLEYSIMLKRDVLVLMMAYPESIAGVETIDNNVYLAMKSGNRILYDDKKVKTFDEKITNADLQDMLETLYPLSETNTLMSTNFDPGRTRAYSFLDEL